MHLRGIAALGAVLVGTACEVPVSSVAPTLAVGSVAVQPKTATLLVGDSVRLSANVAMSNGSVAPTIAWTSSNTGLATVSTAGVVRGVAAGAVIIRAGGAGLQDSAAVAVVTPSPLPVGAVVLAPASATLTVGGTLQLTATPKDATGTPLGGRVVTWTSGNPGVSTVSATGLLSAVAPGSTTITAVSETVSGTMTITVAAPVSAPGTVSDLAVAGVSDTAVTLSFTEVTDGSGRPASYDVRYGPGPSLSWGGSTPSVSRGTCTTPVAGTAIGAARTCTVLGLAAATTYSFQLVAFRGALNVTPAFGALSNVASGTTARGGSGTPSGTIYFNSDFESGTLGDLSVFSGGGGTCTPTAEAARSGGKSAKCVTNAGAAAEAALWYTWGNKPGEPANPALSEANGFYQKFSVMFAPGSFANVYNGGSNSQFKVLLNRSDWHYGYVGAWFMTSWGVNYGNWPPLIKNNGDNCSGSAWSWPYGLQEGVWYDITTWFKRDGTTHKGHAKMWVNGVLVTNTDAMPPDWSPTANPAGYDCLGTDLAADQQEFEVGATYTQNTVGAFTVYVDDVEAANFPIGAAAAALVSRRP